MRRILLLAGAVVFVDTVFFAALTPLLPHYADSVGLGKAGAGFLAACYPLGTLVAALPSGTVATRLGVKTTVGVGLCGLAATTFAFGFVSNAWELDLTRFCQGVSGAFSWTGALAWLVASAPSASRGSLIGKAFAAAIGGALCGPVVGGIATVVGTRSAFGAVGVVAIGLAAWAFTTPAARPLTPQPISALAGAVRDRGVLVGAWLVLLPALLFGSLGVLAPLKLATLGLGGVAIGGVWLLAGVAEVANNVFIGRMVDRRGPLAPVPLALVGTIVLAALLPWPNDRLLLAALVIVSGVVFGAFYTPGMTLLSHAAEERGLEHGWIFALMNLAWAPGQAGGSALSGAVAHATSDAVPYLGLSGAALVTLLALRRSPLLRRASAA